MPETCEDREYRCCEVWNEEEHRAEYGYPPAGYVDEYEVETDA